MSSKTIFSNHCHISQEPMGKGRIISIMQKINHIMLLVNTRIRLFYINYNPIQVFNTRAEYYNLDLFIDSLAASILLFTAGWYGVPGTFLLVSNMPHFHWAPEIIITEAKRIINFKVIESANYGAINHSWYVFYVVPYTHTSNCPFIEWTRQHVFNIAIWGNMIASSTGMLGETQ